MSIIREVLDRPVAASVIVLAARIIFGGSIRAHGHIVRSRDGLGHTGVTILELLVILHRLPSFLALERRAVCHKIVIGKRSGEGVPLVLVRKLHSVADAHLIGIEIPSGQDRLTGLGIFQHEEVPVRLALDDGLALVHLVFSVVNDGLRGICRLTEEIF